MRFKVFTQSIFVGAERFFYCCPKRCGNTQCSFKIAFFCTTKTYQEVRARVHDGPNARPPKISTNSHQTLLRQARTNRTTPDILIVTLVRQAVQVFVLCSFLLEAFSYRGEPIFLFTFQRIISKILALALVSNKINCKSSNKYLGYDSEKTNMAMKTLVSRLFLNVKCGTKMFTMYVFPPTVNY